VFTNGSTESKATQNFYAEARLFGLTKRIFEVDSSGRAYMTTSGSKGLSTSGRVLILGNEHWGNSSSSGPTSYSHPFFRTLIHKQKTYLLAGFIPITVIGDVTMIIVAGMNATAVSGVYDSRVAGSHYGRGTASIGMGGDIDAQLDAFAGWDDVAAVGVTGEFRLLDVDVTPTADSLQIAKWGGSQTYVYWSNTLPISVKSMAGKIKIWAEYLWQKHTNTVFNWNAPFENSWTQVNNTGTVFL
jgi:hypothetical protein